MPSTDLDPSGLTARDAGVERHHLAAAQAVLGRLVRGQPRLAFVSGSLAAGLGHSASDLDVYLLGPEDEAPPPLGTYNEGGVHVQINLLTESDAALAIKGCSTFDIDHSNRWQVDLSEGDLIRTVRLGIGTILTNSLPGLAPERERRSIVRRVLISWHSRDLSSDAEDVWGALGSDDLLTGLTASGLALRQGIECALAAGDDLYYGAKFLLRRSMRTSTVSPLLPTLWNLLRDPEWPPEPGLGWRLCRTRLLVASALSCAASLQGWSQAATKLELPLPVQNEPELRRAPWHVPIRFGDEWALSGPDRGLRISEDLAVFWLNLDGSVAGLRDRLTAASGSFASASEDQLTRTLHRFVALGAAEYDAPSDG
jgi:hypothetical protein